MWTAIVTIFYFTVDFGCATGEWSSLHRYYVSITVNYDVPCVILNRCGSDEEMCSVLIAQYHPVYE